MNINTLGISQLKRTGIGEFDLMTTYVTMLQMVDTTDQLITLVV